MCSSCLKENKTSRSVLPKRAWSSLVLGNKPFPWPGHKLHNKPCWDVSHKLGLPTRRKVRLVHVRFPSFGSHTTYHAAQHGWFWQCDKVKQMSYFWWSPRLGVKRLQNQREVQLEFIRTTYYSIYGKRFLQTKQLYRKHFILADNSVKERRGNNQQGKEKTTNWPVCPSLSTALK